MNRQTNKLDTVHLILTSITLTACIVLTIMLGIFGAKTSRTEKFVSSHQCPTQIVPDAQDTSANQAVVSPARMYVLGAKDGKLTVYASDGYTIVDILDTYVYSLPLSDREAVAQGIPIYSVNELISLIEDYTS